MLAMNYRGPFRVRIDEKPYPRILHPNDAIERVLRSCICYSDLHLYHGMVPDTRVGMTFGHEFIGVVEETVKKGGIVSIVGVYRPTDVVVPIGKVVNKGITIRANQASVKRLLPKHIKHVMDGVINPKEIITHRLPLSEISDAYRMFSAKLDNCIKMVLIPDVAY